MGLEAILITLIGFAGFWYLVSAGIIVMAGKGWMILALLLLILYWVLKKK